MKKTYLHAVEKSNGIVFWNLGVTKGVLLSPENINDVPVGYMTTFPTGKFPEGNTIAYVMKAVNSPSNNNYVSLKKVAIDELRNNPNAVRNFVGRRSTWYVWAGAILRNGGKVGIGVAPYKTKWPSENEKKRIIRVSDLELKFEEIRRKINPELPSRLACLYLADNSVDGRKVIQNSIKGSYEIFEVCTVDCKALLRVDMRWVDLYSKETKEEYIENYWLGKPLSITSDGDCLWEYLLEGSAELVDKSNLKSIQNFGVQLINANKS